MMEINASYNIMLFLLHDARRLVLFSNEMFNREKKLMANEYEKKNDNRTEKYC